MAARSGSCDYAAPMSIDVHHLLDDVHRGRRTVVATAVVLVALFVGTLIGPLAGGAAAAGLAPIFGAGISDEALNTAVLLGSFVFSVPISAFLLGWSFVWHLRVRGALQTLGVERPAVGILQPARFVAVPLAVSVGVASLVLPVAWFLPWPPAGSVAAVVVGGLVVVWMTLGPLVGLLVGVRRGLDRAATARFHAGELSLDDVPDDGRTFPLIARRARRVIRAELLRRAGRLEEAGQTLQAHAARSGVGAQETLLAWARVHRDAGRQDLAEQSLAAAARLVPIDLSALRLLAEMRREAGQVDEARHIEQEVAAIREGNLGLVLGASQRVQA